jgi:hypothetical protein
MLRTHLDSESGISFSILPLPDRYNEVESDLTTGGNSQMSETDVIANQKHILQNQKAILANQKTIKSNQETIKKTQEAILKNQATLGTIVQNQKKILAKLK